MYVLNSCSYFYGLIEKPKISEGPKDLLVQENLDAVFHCWTTGDPEPIIIWKKVDGQMPQGRSVLYAKITAELHQ